MFPSQPLRITGLIGGLCLTLVMQAALTAQTTDPRVVERYRQMLAANPVEGTALDRLWEIVQKEGKTQEWVARYRAEAEKGDFSSQMILGYLLRRSGEAVEAKKAFEAAAEARAESPLPWLALAEGEPEARRAALLEKAVGLLAPDALQRPAIVQKLGAAWLAAGERAKAAEVWEGLIPTAADPMVLRQELATLYAGAGMGEEANRHYLYLQTHGDPATRLAAHRAQAALLGATKAPQEALTHYEQALGLVAPGHWQFDAVLGEMLRLARKEGLLADLRQQWEAKGDAASDRLAALYEMEGDRKALIELLRISAKRNPKDVALRLRLARLLKAEGEFSQAAGEMDAILPLVPQDGLAPVLIERAELDLQLGDREGAAKRLLDSPLTGEPWQEQLRAFFRTHQMDEAMEAELRRRGTPLELAEHLYTRQRPEEAQKALAAHEAQRTASQWRAVSLLHQRFSQEAAALIAARKALALEPERYEHLRLVGELLWSAGEARDARAMFDKAYHAASTPREKEEADLLFFNSFGPVPTTGRRSDAARAMEELLHIPSVMAQGGAPPSTPERRDQMKWLREDKTADGLLRYARWQYWNRDLFEAKTTIARAIAEEPDRIDLHEMALILARATDDRNGVIREARRLAELEPEGKARRLREVALLSLQYGDQAEAIALFRELALEGDPSALADLATALQQAEFRDEAVEVWRRLYETAPAARKVEALMAWSRALHHIGHHTDALEQLWAEVAKSPQAPPPELIRDLIGQAAEHQRLDWLIAHAEKLPAGTAWRAGFLAEVFKADHQPEKAYTTLRDAALLALDRASAEGQVVSLCRDLSQFSRAAAHQRLRIQALENAPLDEWMTLAELEQTALHELEAGAVWDEIVRRFSHSPAALVAAARYFQPVDRGKALELLRQSRRLHSRDLQTALWLMRWSGDREEIRAAAETVLATTAGVVPKDRLYLPPLPAVIGLRLRTAFSIARPAAVGSNGSVLEANFINERAESSAPYEWRLEAISHLAPQILSPEHWLGRLEKSTPSERLWAALGSEQTSEVVGLMTTLSSEHPGSATLGGAISWMLLSEGEWRPLSTWLSDPGRSAGERAFFFRVFGEWALLGDPVGPLPDSFAREAAEVLASRNRLKEAVVFAAKAGPDASSFGFSVATWKLLLGDREGALMLLRKVAAEPADNIDAPTYSAQRLLWFLLKGGERERWMGEVLKGHAASPLHEALTRALLGALSGDDAARNAGLDAVLRQAPSLPGQNPIPERTWNFYLQLGRQFQDWGLESATRYLWERVLKNPLEIDLYGSRMAAYGQEMQAGLVAMQLLEGDRRQAALRLREANFDPPTLLLLASVLEAAGDRPLTHLVFRELKAKDPRLSPARLLNASSDPQWQREVLDEWTKAPEADFASAPLLLETLATVDPGAVAAAAGRILEAGGPNPRIAELLADHHARQGEWDVAVRLYGDLLSQHQKEPAINLGYAEALLRTGKRKEALAALRATPRRSGEMDARRAQLFIQLGQFPEAWRIGEEMARAGDAAWVLTIGTQWVNTGHADEAAIFLYRASRLAGEADKPRAAFEILKGAITLLGEKAPARWLAELEGRADRPEFLSAYYEMLEPSVRLAVTRRAWEKGVSTAGPWQVISLLEAGEREKALGLLPKVCPRQNSVDLMQMVDRFPKDQEVVLSVLSFLAERSPSDFGIQERLIAALHRFGQEEEARARLSRVASLMAKEWNGAFARWADRLGEKELAKRLYTVALATDPAAKQMAVYDGAIGFFTREGDLPAAKRAIRRAYANPAHAEDIGPILDYLRLSGREGELEGELRDFALPPSLQEAVRKALEKTP